MRDPQPQTTLSQVTVVIPAWGKYADHRLDEALASIRAQDVPVEILLVDNASDPPLERPGVTIVRSENRVSVGAARDLGLRAVRTPVSVFWDADDVMLDGALGRMVRALDQDPDLVACATSLVDATTGRRHHWPRRWPLSLSRVPTVFATLNAITSLYPVIGAAVRTSEAQQTGFPDANGGDDWVMGVSLAMRGRITLDECPGRLYRRHEQSISSDWKTSDVLTNAKLVRRRLREDPKAPRAIRVVAPVIWLGQHLVLQVLRPIARQTPARRRAAA